MKRMKKIALSALILFAVTLAPAAACARVNSITIGRNTYTDLAGSSRLETGVTWNSDGRYILRLDGGGFNGGVRIDVECSPNDTVYLAYEGDVWLASSRTPPLRCTGIINISGSYGTLFIDVDYANAIKAEDIVIASGAVEITKYGAYDAFSEYPTVGKDAIVTVNGDTYPDEGCNNGFGAGALLLVSALRALRKK